MYLGGLTAVVWIAYETEAVITLPALIAEHSRPGF